MKIFAVTGKPIFHSKSPVMFNRAFKETGIDAIYLKLSAMTAAEALKTAKAIGISGLNVTSPFKEDMMKLVDEFSQQVNKIKSINSVVIEGEKTTGHNTDYLGVRGALENTGVEFEGKKAVVLGAGGAGRAALSGLMDCGIEPVIINRTLEKAQQAAGEIGCRFSPIENLASEISRADILISCISDSGGVVNPSLLRKSLVVLDANYRGSSLLDDARDAGCIIAEPLDWLLYQALPAFEIFTGISTDKEVMRKALQEDNAEKKSNIAIVGFMGSGKSMTARHIGEKTGRIVVDLDKEIEKREGRTITKIFEQDGEETFRKIEAETLEKFLKGKNQVVSCGGGAVLYEKNVGILKNSSITVWLWAGVDDILKRTEKNNNRPLLDTGDRRGRIEYLLSRRIDFYAKSADMIINTGEHTADETARIIIDEVCE
jgi:shikimate dehydrogenase